jgi:hypothetical protein
VDVFGRSPQSDLGEDTIVRVCAREVRRRLAQYYSTPEGAAVLVRINLPSGAYVPEFRYAEVNDTSPAPGVRPPEPAAPVRRRLSTRVRAGLAALVATAAVILWMVGHESQPGFQRFRLFWEPVFRTPSPMLLAVGNPLVYHPSLRALKLNEERLPAPPWPMLRPLQLAPDELNGSDLVPVTNQYVGFGDMVAAAEVAAMLGRRSKDFHVRLASTVPFADLRKVPALLIGAITNRWTMELGQSWRFRFSRTPGLSNVIVDTNPPAGGPQQWDVPAREDGQVPEDYVLISRVPHSSTGGLVIVAAGVKQFGTEAAGHLLSDPLLLDSVLGKLPAGWENRNLQLVLGVKVIGNTPAQPEMLAWHVW